MTGQFTDHQEQVTAAMTVSSSPAPSSTGKKSAEHRRKAERSASKEQKPSKSTTSKPPSDGGGAAVIVGHPNVTALSSHPHRHRKGQVQAQGQKRGGAGGGGRPPNWHELTSTEQSIAMMLRCQDLESRELLPSAVSCRNLRSDKVCNYLFHEVDRKTGRRDVKCNLQGIEDIAESCRKTCGICCEDINYACEDDKNGIIDCSRQLEKCHQKKWFGVLSRFCAGSCGLCAMTSCRDYDNSCRVRKTICLKPDSVDYMRENCARTCGFCVVGEDAGGGEKNKGDNRENKEKAVLVERPPLTQHRLIVPECTDKASNCSTNAHLCGNPAHGEYMVKFCTKTCLKCNQPHTSINSRAKTTEFPAPPPLEVIIQPMLGESEDTLLTRKCRDQHEKCAQWKAEGLCKANSTFKQEQRNKCPKSCELCRE